MLRLAPRENGWQHESRPSLQHTLQNWSVIAFDFLQDNRTAGSCAVFQSGEYGADTDNMSCSTCIIIKCCGIGTRPRCSKEE